MKESIEERVRPAEHLAPPPAAGQRSWFHRKFLASILHLNGTPEAVARGVSLGILIAMTPTVGFQMVMVLVIHTLLRANRIAGIIMVYISNPFTIVPIYWLDYIVGSFILGRPLYTYEAFARRARAMGELAAGWDFWGATRQVLEVGGDLVVPMMLGGIMVGLVLAAPLYVVTLAAVRRHRARRDAKHASRREDGDELP